MRKTFSSLIYDIHCNLVDFSDSHKARKIEMTIQTKPSYLKEGQFFFISNIIISMSIMAIMHESMQKGGRSHRWSSRDNNRHQRVIRTSPVTHLALRLPWHEEEKNCFGEDETGGGTCHICDRSLVRKDKTSTSLCHRMGSCTSVSSIQYKVKVPDGN